MIRRFLFSGCFILGMVAAYGQASVTGRVVFLNSKKEPDGEKIPAVNVQVNSTGSNGDFSRQDGAYTLYFPHLKPGAVVQAHIGKKGEDPTDGKGTKLELVNDKDLHNLILPAKEAEISLQIVVCPKGYRDLIAQKYYGIVKTSSDFALKQKTEELLKLQKESVKSAKTVEELSKEIEQLSRQNDSAQIYKEAFLLASINKDDAGVRVLRYLRLIENGTHIQEARRVLNRELAEKEGRENARNIKQTITELELEASAARLIFDYDSEIKAYRSIQALLEEMGDLTNPIKKAEFNLKLGIALQDNGDFAEAIHCQEKAIAVYTKSPDVDSTDLGAAYYLMATGYSHLADFHKAMDFIDKATRYWDGTPKDSVALWCRVENQTALIFIGLGEHEKGLTLFKGVLEKFRTSSVASNIDWATMHNNIAGAYAKLGKYTEALDFCKEAVALYEQEGNRDVPGLVVSLSNIGTLYVEMERFRDALQYNERAMKIAQDLFHSNHPILANVYDERGRIYSEIGNYNQALDFHNRALSIKNAVFDDFHPTVASSYNSIAAEYRELGDYENSLKFCRKAIEIQERSGGEKSEPLALYYSSIASTLGSLQRFVESVKYAEQAIVLGEEVFRPDHSSLARVYHQGLSSYFNAKQYEKALEMGYKAMAIREIPGQRRLDLAGTYNNISMVYRQIEKFGEALEFSRKSVELLEEAQMAKASDFAIAYKGLAAVYKGLQQFEMAIGYAQKAITVIERAKEDYVQRQIPSAYADLASICLSFKKYEEALEHAVKAVSVGEKLEGVSSRVLSESYTTLANVLADMHRYEEARLINDKAFAIRNSETDKNHYLLAQTLNLYGNIYRGLGQFDKAIEYSVESIKVLERDSDDRELAKADCYETLGSIYFAKSEFQKAREYQGKVASIRAAELDPEHSHLASIYTVLGNTSYALQLYDDALGYHEKALAIFLVKAVLEPLTIATSYNNIGLAYFGKGENEKASFFFEKAIADFERESDPMSPDLAQLYFNTGAFYQHLKQWEKSIAYFEKSIEIFKNSSYYTARVNLYSLYSTLAAIYSEVKRYENALKCAKLLIALLEQADEDLPVHLMLAYNRAGISCHALGDLDLAVQFQQKAIEKSGNLPESNEKDRQQVIRNLAFIYKDRANAKFDREEYTEALADLEKVHALSEIWDAWNLTGLCFLNLENNIKAIDAYSKAKEIADKLGEDYSFFSNNIGVVYAKSGAFEKAFFHFTEYLRDNPENGFAYRNWAVYHALQGERELALEYLTKAIEKGYQGIDFLKKDSSLTSIREDIIFRNLLKKIEEDLEAER